MMEALRAGVAVFDSGYYYAAHDVWEAAWLEERDGLLQGLIQYAGAVHHARERNWEGCVSLAGSAREYLVAADARGVNVSDVREYLVALEADPERVERGPPQGITIDGEIVGLGELDAEAALWASPALAEERGENAVIQGVAYAREDFESGEADSVFVRLAIDFVTDADKRAIIAQRLGEHAEERRRRERDVEGLF
ncbi:DUF309 domain-containing protein [Salarchaeum japonicum]|uniref:DUF309 domain-containing protein n=1 Tax=Salarchaeum japonicum TaxID=555573 RepID=A0AAV3T1K8_9EURY|nr:DUF309 domain-containing protein [Salarchaeum japonicum]